MRKKIIASYTTDLDFETVEKLARATRGLIKQDIEKSIDEFRLNGSISYHIDHPTNTCDPYTGNWCEHLMDFNWLKQILSAEGFKVKIIPGHYNTYGSLLMKSVKILLNMLIRILGKYGLSLSPYYVIYADFAGAEKVTKRISN